MKPQPRKMPSAETARHPPRARPPADHQCLRHDDCLGASIMVPEAIAAMAAIGPEFVEIDQLQRAASRSIARLTGGEAGFITASCASGIAVAIAGAMTRDDLLAVESLPDASGLKDEVLIQVGHMVSYGAPVEQSIRLAGGKVVPVGAVSGASATSSRAPSASAPPRRSTSSRTTPCSTA